MEKIVKKYQLDEIQGISLDIQRPCIIFLRGDLAAWKTTFTKHILADILKIDDDITSPTYTYYNKYDNHYHFDLYRMKDYDEFFAIGWEDILDNNSWVILIEWPELIEHYYTPDIDIFLEKTENSEERKITLTYT